MRPRRCPFAAQVQLRAHATPVACEVTRGDDGGLRIALAEEQRGVAPGQSAVLYEPDAERGDRVLGQAAVETARERQKRFVTSSWLRGRQRLASVTSRFPSVNN